MSTNEYLQYIHDQTVDAIVAAFNSRRKANVRAGHSDASDLIYNQSCSEALNQDKEPAYPGPEVCATPGKDGMVRVVQATDPKSGSVIATFMAYAAHATAGGGNGLHGDWPQFLSDKMSAELGGVGLAMVGALGGTQPCRSACAFTNPSNPGYDIDNRKQAIVSNYFAHVESALVSGHAGRAARSTPRKSFIREPITGPAVLALFAVGSYDGARLLRSRQNPWVVGNTIRTVTSALRVGGVLFSGTPGEGFPAIGDRHPRRGHQRAGGHPARPRERPARLPDRARALRADHRRRGAGQRQHHLQRVADDRRPRDVLRHRARARDRVRGRAPAECAPYGAADSAGDPVAQVPVGGVPDPVVK